MWPGFISLLNLQHGWSDPWAPGRPQAHDGLVSADGPLHEGHNWPTLLLHPPNYLIYVISSALDQTQTKTSHVSGAFEVGGVPPLPPPIL